jgi:hypothetical protein
MTEQPLTDDGALSRLVQWHESADFASADAREECERDRDYVDGYQWTEAEIETLKKRKQPVVTINRIKPKVDFLKGQEQQRRMMPRAYPRTPAEEEGANAATDAIRYVMDASKWDRERSGCFDNHIVEGACGADIQVYQKQDGDYCVEVKQILWDRMWWDEHSRMPDFSDAKYKGQFVWMDEEDALARWPDKASIIEGTLATAQVGLGTTYEDVPRTRWVDSKRKRIRVAECWSRENGKVYFSVFTKGGVLERFESEFVDEDGNPDDGFVFGSCYIDRDGNRYGVVRSWISIQDEINKRRSKAMHLMSVRQTFGNQTVDKNKLRAELAKPDGHAEMQGGAKFGEDFGVLPTNDMGEAQFKLLQEAKAEIDSVGVNAALSGNEERVMSGRALLARSEQGLSELGPVFDRFAQFQHDVYRKVWNRIRQFWTQEKWIRVTDDERNVRFVGLNQPITLGDQLLEEFKKQPGVTPEAIAAAEQQARMDPRMQVVVGQRNKVAELDVDLVLDDVPASATLQTETFEQLVQLAPHIGAMPPPMFEALIEASPLRNKDKVLKKLKGEEEGQQIPPQVQQAMAEQEQALMQAQEELAKTQQQLVKAQTALPMVDMKAREQELKYREDMLKLREENATLRIQMLPQEIRAQITGEAPPEEEKPQGPDTTAMLAEAIGQLTQVVAGAMAPKPAMQVVHQRDANGRLIASVAVPQEVQ